MERARRDAEPRQDWPWRGGPEKAAAAAGDLKWRAGLGESDWDWRGTGEVDGGGGWDPGRRPKSIAFLEDEEAAGIEQPPRTPSKEAVAGGNRVTDDNRKRTDEEETNEIEVEQAADNKSKEIAQ